MRRALLGPDAAQRAGERGEAGAGAATDVPTDPAATPTSPPPLVEVVDRLA